MKFLFALVTLSFASVAALASSDTDSTGNPGDNFSLEGALSLFKDAEDLEAFEKALNTESSEVNNLDLNEDGEVDYIRTEDFTEGDVHAIVLQAVLGEDEMQDIAVIEIEKTGAEEAVLQIVGDEEIYGEELRSSLGKLARIG